ncbi:hypothetical protein SETIT_9G227800v2 [Setaria italica]|uniref:Uncharacterized protein n=1 Tax=Setaria italica TaxID=4555 RepID=A0A368SJI8_SETIT|nr:hypothetical protein SETIT_9G227800v2 [Setaria italica]
MASLLGLHTGRPPAAGRWSTAAVKQLLSRLMRSTWRRGAARPRRRAAVRSFGYDLQSYSQNFDDGIGCSGGHHFSVIPCVTKLSDSYLSPNVT